MRDNDDTFLPPDESDNDLSDLYGQTRTDSDTPELDKLILNSAKAAVVTTAVVVPFHGWRRWSTPVAAAATLLLGVSVVFNILLFRQESHTSIYPAPVAEQKIADMMEGQKFEAEPVSTAVVADSPPVLSSADDAASTPVSLDQFNARPQSVEMKKSPGRKQMSGSIGQLQERTEADSSQEVEELVRFRLQKPSSEMDKLDVQIEEIIKLLQAGQLKEAQQALDQLIKEYPELLQ